MLVSKRDGSIVLDPHDGKIRVTGPAGGRMATEGNRYPNSVFGRHSDHLMYSVGLVLTLR
jgi:hypothetical protein